MSITPFTVYVQVGSPVTSDSLDTKLKTHYKINM